MTVRLTRKLLEDTTQHSYKESGQPKLRQTKLQKCFTFVTVREKSAQADPKIRAKSVLQDFCPEIISPCNPNVEYSHAPYHSSPAWSPFEDALVADCASKRNQDGKRDGETLASVDSLQAKLGVTTYLRIDYM